VPTAALAFDFDPIVRIADRAIRLETLALAGILFGGLLLAALLARRSPIGPAEDRLRLDDLLFVVLGVLPGAVLGGRLGYGLIHLDYYLAHPAAIVDPSQGALGLSGGVVGGLVTGLYVGRLLEAPVGRWAHVLAIPLLAVLGLGKVAMALGGSGQGQPSDAPWATAYVGPGPWGSLAPAVPSIPSQLLEAAGVGVVLLVLVGCVALGAFARGDGRLFLVALAGWALVRVLVATTWRDPAVLGPLRANQLVDLVIAAGAILAFVAVGRSAGGGVERRARDRGGAFGWPSADALRTWRRDARERAGRGSPAGRPGPDPEGSGRPGIGGGGSSFSRRGLGSPSA
jgi:phosphatidylglycerol:prolipoprotein diacylglycerol transferase